MTLLLERFFNPRSVAFIGATDDTSKFGGKCLANLFKVGYEGEILPVNPKRDTLFGKPCYPSIQDLPRLPDHVGIALPAAVALDAVEACGRAGIPFATLFTAGFAETGAEQGRALQQRLVDICAATGIRVMGPNCNGLVNYVDRFAFTSTAVLRGDRPPPGDVGVASQSGGAGQVNVMWRAQEAGLAISYQVSSGNDADLNLLDYLEFMVESERTTVALLIAERIADGERLRRIAERAATLDKVIAMVKVGRSDAGARAAASHTGSLTGADEVADAALRQYGIVRAQDPAELVELARLMRRRNRPRGTRVSAASVSGGNLVMAVDIAAAAGLEWPGYGDDTKQSLTPWIPSFGSIANPTDLTAGSIGRDDALTSVGRLVLADPVIDTFVVVLTMAKRGEIEAAAEFAMTADKPVVVLWTGGCIDEPDFTIDQLVARGVPAYRDAVPCFNAIGASARLARQRGAVKLPRLAAERAASAPAEASVTLTERASKRWLAAYGLPVTRESLATTADQAAEAARAIAAPLAIKIESADIPHKTEAGAIRLDVLGEAAARRAFDEVMTAARVHAPRARLDGVLVQAMSAPGFELLLGVATDPVFGPVVTVGAGGIFVETLRDVARRVVPVDAVMAAEMLGELRVFPILQGTRGQGALDVPAVVEAIVALSRFIEAEHDRVAEVDINPLVVHAAGQGATVVDALIVTGEPAVAAAPIGKAA